MYINYISIKLEKIFFKKKVLKQTKELDEILKKSA